MHNGHGEKKSDGHMGDVFAMVEPKPELMSLAVSRWCVHKSRRYDCSQLPGFAVRKDRKG